MKTLVVTALATIICVATAHSRSHYATVHNQFASLVAMASPPRLNHATWHIADNLLHIDNHNAHTLMLTDTLDVAAEQYQYLVRTSVGNKAGHSYTVVDSTGAKHRVENVAWGIVFDYHDPQHYHRVQISCSHSDLYDDLTDEQSMTLSVFKADGGSEVLLHSCPVKVGVDMDNGLNTLMVAVADHRATLQVGKTRLHTVTSIDLDDSGPSVVKTGLCLSPGARVAVERTTLSTDSQAPRHILTTWTREALDQHLAMSSDPIEGYWQYQDRDMEDKWLRLGGRYTVAVVAASGGYDIIYLSGAQVNATQWQPGMLKGHISKTIFDGHYDLEWIDATFLPITLDAYAAFSDGVLMTLNFPVYNSQMRLSKVLAP